jgi:outer membrane receptor protein involved in Fe transport
MKRIVLSVVMVVLLSLPVSVILSKTAFAQDISVSGMVSDKEGNPLAGVKIAIKGTVAGTISNTKGKFALKTSVAPPFKLIFSIIGFSAKEVPVTASAEDLKIQLEEKAIRGEDIVVSASRVPESIMQSPVTVEKVDIKSIQNAPTAEYYDAVANLKGVQTYTGSLTFQTFNTRGFATIANTRFVQLVDGMDVADPLLNFPTGNLVGIGELDAESMELVPGAASALYGPNAFNGILLMSSKNPFDYQGISAQVKGGMTNSASAGANPYLSAAVRYAAQIGDNFAFKVNLSYLTGTDWQGNDYDTHREASGNPKLNQWRSNFDGLNLYGDETPIAVPITAALANPALAPLRNQIIALNTRIGGLNLKRTGIKEQDLIRAFDDGFQARNLKADVALNYRISNSVEASYNFRFGSGSSLYQGAEKYILRGFSEQFHKLEFKGNNFFVRAYATFSGAGDSYNLSALGAYVNERFSPSSTRWVPTYLGTFVGAMVPIWSVGATPTDAQILAAQNAARAAADNGRPTSDSQAFRDTVNAVRKSLFQRNPPGAGFVNTSQMYHGEFNYNFKELTDIAEIQVGGNFRRYDLFSDGTVFNEELSGTERKRLTINEFGIYTQISKKLLEDKLKLTGSLRVDKNENFDAILTPRVSAVWTVAESHNIRASFQTGFRNPDTQAQFIWFPSGAGILLGSTSRNAKQYGIHEGGAYSVASYAAFLAAGGTLSATGTIGGAAAAQSLLQTVNLPYIKPERLQAIELGYKGIIDNTLFLDINGYFNIYNDFIGAQTVVSKNPTTRAASATAANPTGAIPAGTNFRPYTNAQETITAQGVAVGFSYKLPRGFDLDGSYSYNDFAILNQQAGSEFEAQFNTPRNRFNVSISNRELVTNFGFMVNYRWQEAFLWQSAFGSGTIPSYGVIDAQINYAIKDWKTIIKIGANNLLGNDYRTNIGAGYVGQLYYVSLTFNEFMN